MKVRGYDRGTPVLLELVEVQPGQYLERVTADAFESMNEAYKIEVAQQYWACEYGLQLNSGYRSFKHQQQLYDEWERWRTWNVGGRKGDEPLPRRKFRPSAPGYSEHHTGEAADINRSHDDPDGAGPLLGPTDQWLTKRGPDFGFHRTVRGERWHFRHLQEEAEDGA